jgi:hypothetical protein
MVHFNNASATDTTMMCPLRLERFATTTKSTSLLSWHNHQTLQLLFFLSFYFLLGFGKRLRIGWHRTGIGCHCFEMSRNRQCCQQRKPDAIPDACYAQTPDTIFARSAHPGWDQNEADSIHSIGVQTISYQGAKEATTIQVQPISVERSGTTESSTNCCCHHWDRGGLAIFLQFYLYRQRIS